MCHCVKQRSLWAFVDNGSTHWFLKKLNNSGEEYYSCIPVLRVTLEAVYLQCIIYRTLQTDGVTRDWSSKGDWRLLLPSCHATSGMFLCEGAYKYWLWLVAFYWACFISAVAHLSLLLSRNKTRFCGHFVHNARVWVCEIREKIQEKSGRKLTFLQIL